LSHFGVPLLIRSAKGVELTSYGNAVLERARCIVSEVDRSVDDVRALESGELGSVTLGITQNYAHYVIPELLTELENSRRGLRFDVKTGGFLDLVDMILDGSIDIGFGLLGTFDRPNEVLIENLKEHRSRIICHRRHPLAKAKSIDVRDLAAARWANLRGEGFQRNFIRFFEMRGFQIPVQVLKSDSIDLIKSFVCQTDVLTVLPLDAVRDRIEDGSLSTLNCEAPNEITQLGLLTRAGSFMPTSVRLIADAIRRVMLHPAAAA